jgi:hypothetical protein
MRRSLPATATITPPANLFTLPPVPIGAEYRQFPKFIVLTMMLLSSHDSAIGWDEGFRSYFRRIPCSTICKRS